MVLKITFKADALVLADKLAWSPGRASPRARCVRAEQPGALPARAPRDGTHHEPQAARPTRLLGRPFTQAECHYPAVTWLSQASYREPVIVLGTLRGPEDREDPELAGKTPPSVG